MIGVTMNLLVFVLFVIVFLLVSAILLQPGESGGMFSGGALMSGGENYHTRRGLEKVLFYASFVLLALFAVLSIIIVR